MRRPSAACSARRRCREREEEITMDHIDPVSLARLQFAMTALYHFLFVPLTLGLSFLLNTALICRVSTQITGKPASARALNSHCDNGPASSPIRLQWYVGFASTCSRASGSLATFTSRTILPVSSTMQTLVSLTDTSNPAKSACGRLLSCDTNGENGRL